MTVVCPQCGAPIPAKNANIDTMIAKCEKCNAIFDFRHQLASDQDKERQGARRPPARPSVPIPEGITIEHEDAAGSFGMAFRSHGGGVQPLTIRMRWFEPKHLVFLLFGIVFGGMSLMFIITSALAGAPLFAVLFPMIHLAVGASLTYVGLAMLINSTQIRFDGNTLSVRHGPLPWIGNGEFPVEQIAQLYVTERKTANRRRNYVVYDLHVVLQDQTSHRLLRSLPSPHKALYIEQEIERALGIVDKPVAGELAK